MLPSWVEGKSGGGQGCYFGVLWLHRPWSWLENLDFPVNGSFYYFHDLGLFLEPLCLTFYIGKLNQVLPFPAAHRKPMRIDEVASGAHFVFLQRVHLGDAGRQS